MVVMGAGSRELCSGMQQVEGKHLVVHKPAVHKPVSKEEERWTDGCSAGKSTGCFLPAFTDTKHRWCPDTLVNKTLTDINW